MPCTDERLAIFEQVAAEHKLSDLASLIARLKAAEVCAEQLVWHNRKLACGTDAWSTSSLTPHYRLAAEALAAWRKEAGKLEPTD